MTKIIAHRGYSKLYPENTMLAFKKAAEHDIDGIELDVQLSKDGQVIICHDETIDRTSNGQGFIKDMTLAELKEYQFASHFDLSEIELEQTKLSTLDEFFAWFIDYKFIVNIELKTNIFDYPGLLEKVAELINHYQVQDRVIISSFNHHSIREMQSMAPHLEYGFLTANSLLDPGSYCQKYQVAYYHPHFITLIEADMINLKAEDIGTNVYTVNKSEDMKKLVKLGVSSVITDDVELAVFTLK